MIKIYGQSICLCECDAKWSVKESPMVVGVARGLFLRTHRAWMDCKVRIGEDCEDDKSMGLEDGSNVRCALGILVGFEDGARARVGKEIDIRWSYTALMRK
jgi:hypothetical protein